MSRFAGLSQALKPQGRNSPAPEELPDEDDGMEPESQDDEEEKTMTTETPVEQTEAYQAGYAAANARFTAVLASEHYAGREATAQKLLGKAMSADDIIDVLASTPAAAVSATSAEAAEVAARDEMRGAIGANVNSGVTPGAADAPATDAKAAASVWDTAIANEFPKARK